MDYVLLHVLPSYLDDYSLYKYIHLCKTFYNHLKLHKPLIIKRCLSYLNHFMINGGILLVVNKKHYRIKGFEENYSYEEYFPKDKEIIYFKKQNLMKLKKLSIPDQKEVYYH